MAGAFSQNLQQKILDHVFKRTALSQPTNIYVGFCSVTPSDTSLGTELSGTGYTRAVCNNWDAATAASPSVIKNTDIITFPTPGAGGWGVANYFILMDTISDTALSGFLGWGALTIPKTINQNDTVTFAAGQLQITLD